MSISQVDAEKPGLGEAMAVVEQAKTLTEEMLSCAERQHWDCLAELESQRQGLMRRFVEVRARDLEYGPELYDALRHLSILNIQLLQRCEQERDVAAGNLCQSKSTRKALNNYLDNA